jgi:ferritin-like protein
MLPARERDAPNLRRIRERVIPLRGAAMSQAGNALLRGVNAEAVGDLDRLRAAHIVTGQWLLAVENRLEGPAHYLLEDELQEQVEIHRQSAASLAERVAELDGEITGDPTKLLELSGLGSFEMPADTSDPTVITDYALERVRRLIGAYARPWPAPATPTSSATACC